MFARGGYNWILGTLLLSTLSLLCYLLVRVFIILIISIILLLCVIFFLIFFRDPKRKTSTGIVSPADGRVISIHNSKDITRIAIFMSVLNVHVNRAPLTGRVRSMVHKPGGFIPAYEPESSKNERLITIMKTEIGTIKIIQIAGILARRIIPYITQGQYLVKGQRIGTIQFGSRVDVILPRDKVKVIVNPGQRLKAGINTIANII